MQTIKEITEIKITSEPTRTLKYILSENVSAALWVEYRRNHIISDVGLKFLNDYATEVARRQKRGKLPLDRKSVEDRLVSFWIDMADMEESADWFDREKARKWAASTLPYALGEKSYRFTCEYPLELGKK